MCHLQFDTWNKAVQWEKWSYKSALVEQHNRSVQWTIFPLRAIALHSKAAPELRLYKLNLYPTINTLQRSHQRPTMYYKVIILWELLWVSQA